MRMMSSALIERQETRDSRQQIGEKIMKNLSLALPSSCLFSLVLSGLRNLEAVADATNRLDIDRVAGVGFNLLAQPADVNVDRAAVAGKIVAPDPLEQHIA